MLWINPATAWRMLHDFVSLEEGDWFIQNAANSGVGTAAIQIARELGWKSVNVVRRPELVDELLSHGADVVLVDSPDLPAQVKEATGDAKIRLALNAVGGDNAARVTKCLAFGGTIVTYGAMARQPLKVSNAALIFKDIRFRGMWITKWYESATRADIDAMFGELLPMAEKGLLEAPIDAEFLLEDWPQAIKRATQGARKGKVLFRM
jgi:mitochondrial enoyl-[acyl-carrier protein] reductase / trans-2-enoyl-CoA reductase